MIGMILRWCWRVTMIWITMIMSCKARHHVLLLRNSNNNKYHLMEIIITTVATKQKNTHQNKKHAAYHHHDDPYSRESTTNKNKIINSKTINNHKYSSLILSMTKNYHLINNKLTKIHMWGSHLHRYWHQM